MRENFADIKRQWFADAIEEYFNKTDKLTTAERLEGRLKYIDIKNSFAFVSITHPNSGDEPYIITIADNNGVAYDETSGKVTITSNRVSELTRLGTSISIEHFHDKRDGSTMLDWDISYIKGISKAETCMLYKMFKSIENSVNVGLNWLLD